MSYLLDTNICIAILKQADEAVIARVKKEPASDVALCSVVKAELLHGARKSQRVEENLRVLTRFFAEFRSLPFDDPAAAHYGTIRAMLAQAGTPIGANDLLIASIALAHDSTLVTRNRDELQRVPGLRLETW